MILFYTPNSPYARTARIALREWEMLERAEERLAANREANNPVLQFSPVGRVPTLVDGSLVITEAPSVFAYIRSFANCEGAPNLVDWERSRKRGRSSASSKASPSGYAKIVVPKSSNPPFC